MTVLQRHLAPISSEAWQVIDSEAKRVLKLNLAARKLVDFRGPLGWKESSVNLGRAERLREAPADGVEAFVRRVQPLVELRARFELSRAELEDVGRGAPAPNLAPLVEAATRIARAEDRAVFYGYAAGGMRGICDSSAHSPLVIAEDYESYPATVAEAINALRSSAVDGPYALALGPRCYAGLMRAGVPGGYPVFQIVRRIVDGPIVWAPALDGAVLLSVRGGDHELSVGADLSIGYSEHTAKAVSLYLVETMTFRVLTPEAAVALRYKTASSSRKRT